MHDGLRSSQEKRENYVYSALREDAGSTRIARRATRPLTSEDVVEGARDRKSDTLSDRSPDQDHAGGLIQNPPIHITFGRSKRHSKFDLTATHRNE